MCYAYLTLLEGLCSLLFLRLHLSLLSMLLESLYPQCFFLLAVNFFGALASFVCGTWMIDASHAPDMTKRFVGYEAQWITFEFSGLFGMAGFVVSSASSSLLLA